MRPLLRRRSRIRLLWVAFALAAAASGWAVHQLYETARREIDAQSERALRQERDQAVARIRAYTGEVRQTIVGELAGLHVDGLGPALRRWDEINEVITGTFRWEAGRGFLPDSVLPPELAKLADLPELWISFRARRASGPDGANGERSPFAGYCTNEFRLLDNPLFPAERLGYQSENLDMLAYAGQAVDPWAGWAGSVADASAPWVFWYQAGPDAPVRGCLVDVKLIADQLRSEFSDDRLAHIELVAAGERPSGATLGDVLPAHVLRISPGAVLQEKQASARFSALTGGLLLGLVVIGVALLAGLSRREARDAERKITFVSQVSHELRTPLTSIRMFADMLGAPTVPEEKRLKFAGTISRESQRLGALIERLLTFAALEKGKPAERLAPVDVTAVVRETVEEMEGTLQAAGLRTETQWPDEAVTVTTDPSALKQALLNLLDNAAKYASTGGAVRVALVETPELVRVRVSDFGPGIARSLRGELFEPFVQGGQSLTEKAPGVGLGLSIARGLLRAAGGELELVSSARGATFEICLPRVAPS